MPYIQAINELTNKGFRIDTIIQKPNMAIDRVLAVVVKGTNNEISINQELYEGTSVNLIIGSEKEREPIGTPNLIGLIRQDAEMELNQKLNIGTIQLYDGNQSLDYDYNYVISENNKYDYTLHKLLGSWLFIYRYISSSI